MGKIPDVETLQVFELYESLKLFASKNYEKGLGNKIKKKNHSKKKNRANKILMGFLSGAGMKSKAGLSNSRSWV